VDLEAFELVFLRRPPDAAVLPPAELEENHRAHLAYLASLRDRGYITAYGPVDDAAEETLRGIAFYRTGSLEEARRLAEADPGVISGRFVIEVMTWLCRPGSMVAAGRPLTMPAP
jgi:uncharacterized protein YciI